MVLYSMVLNGMVWFGIEWNGMVWCGVVCYAMLCYDMGGCLVFARIEDRQSQSIGNSDYVKFPQYCRYDIGNRADQYIACVKILLKYCKTMFCNLLLCPIYRIYKDFFSDTDATIGVQTH